jgi:hypothetical protein
METGATELDLFHDRDVKPELLGPDRRHVAAGAAAKDDEIIVVLS